MNVTPKILFINVDFRYDNSAGITISKGVIKEFEITKDYNKIADDYKVNNASWRVLILIVVNASLGNLWWGIKKK